jgi:hypothetical protein
MCPEPPLPFGTECSGADTCAALDCGSASSLFDEDGCLRRQCRSADDCAAGERCLPAPVALENRDCWPSGVEGCDESNGNGCECNVYEDCIERAVCVPAADFPTSDDCPTQDLTCAEVRSAVDYVEAYIEPDDEPFADEPLEALEACHDALIDAEPAACDFCESWNGTELGRLPPTPDDAVAAWSANCANRTVGSARGCGLTVVFLVQGESRSYYVYDAGDRPVGYFVLHPGGSTGCDRSTERTGTQIACNEDIADWCDTSLRQLFSLDQQVECATFETCKVCGSGDFADCELGRP